MLEFQLDKLDLARWEEFSEPRETDKIIRLMHKGRNGLILFVTENDDVFIAQKDGHERLACLCGRKIVRLASTLDLVIAGNDRNELFLISSENFSIMFNLQQKYVILIRSYSEKSVRSIIPMKRDGSILLLDCADDSIFAVDKSDNNLALFNVKRRTKTENTERENNYLHADFTTVDVVWPDNSPRVELAQLSCGTTLAAATGIDGTAFLLQQESESECCIFERPLPLPAINVACVKETVAFLLQSGEIFLMNGNASYMFHSAFNTRFTDIISNRNFFAASTDTSVISFTRDKSFPVRTSEFEGETYLLKAFEGTETPSTRSLDNSNRLHREISKKHPVTSNFITTDTLYDTERFSDLTLLLIDGQLRVHKLILSSHSKFFRKLFNSDDWKNDSILDVSSYNSDSYRAYIWFIYARHFNRPDFNYNHLLGAYRIAEANEEDFKDDICSALINCVDTENVCEIFEFSVEYNLKSLEDRCLEVTKDQKIDVIVSESFLDLSLDLRRRLAEFSLK